MEALDVIEDIRSGGSQGEISTTVYPLALEHPKESFSGCVVAAVTDVAVAVRIADIQNQLSIIAVELDGEGGCTPGKVLRRENKRLTHVEMQPLIDTLSRPEFWKMPINNDPLDIGLDGSEWVLEVGSGDQYHVVARWTPQSGVVRDLGLEFLKLAGWKFEGREMY